MDDDVDPTELIRHSVRNDGAALRSGDIGSDKQVLWPKIIRPGPCCDQDRCSGFAQACRHGCADAFRAAGDKRLTTGKW
jgi:hypothetical protein